MADTTRGLTVAITLQHPAHVHFYRNVVDELEQQGHESLVYYRGEELVADLLDRYDIDATALAPGNRGRLHGLANQVRYEAGLLRAGRRARPDVLTGIGGIAAAHVGTLLGVPSVVFTDSGDFAPMNRLGTRFADIVCTPEVTETDYGDRQRRYPGYHELAYLHPDRFEPDSTGLGIDVYEPYSVVRFVGWNAQHDRGQRGFSREQKRRLVDGLGQHGAVYVTAEGRLPPEFRAYRLPVPPDRIHDLLYYADLYVGDSQTMATEAALLGTPAIRSNSFVAAGDMGNFRELEREYGLLASLPDADEAIDQALTWMQLPSLGRQWDWKLDRLHTDKIDVTAFAVDTLVETALRSQ